MKKTLILLLLFCTSVCNLKSMGKETKQEVRVHNDCHESSSDENVIHQDNHEHDRPQDPDDEPNHANNYAEISSILNQL